MMSDWEYYGTWLRERGWEIIDHGDGTTSVYPMKPLRRPPWKLGEPVSNPQSTWRPP